LKKRVTFADWRLVESEVLRVCSSTQVGQWPGAEKNGPQSAAVFAGCAAVSLRRPGIQLGRHAPARKLPVVWAQKPFVGPFRWREFDVALRAPTIAEIVASIPADELPRGFAELGEVHINGEVISRGVWHLVRPRHRPGFDTVVSLHVPLTGGGGGGSSGGSGGKSNLALVASISVLLIAAAVSGGALAGLNLFLGAGALSAGSAGAAIAGIAISTGGTLRISALEPKK
jgi:hypothetical protein